MPLAVNLLDGLRAFWELEEGSGSRFDSMGSNTLTDVNTVTQGAGKVYNAGQFTAANSESLTRASNALLQPAPDFTVQAWVNYTTEGIVATKDAVANNRQWGLDISANKARIFVFDSISGNASAVSATLATSTWFHLIFTYNSSDKKGRVYSNNSAPTATAALTNGILTTGTSAFEIGNRAGSALPYGGLIDQVGYWQRVLTASEIQILYNSGTGLSFAAMVDLSRIKHK